MEADGMVLVIPKCTMSTAGPGALMLPATELADLSDSTGIVQERGEPLPRPPCSDKTSQYLNIFQMISSLRPSGGLADPCAVLARWPGWEERYYGRMSNITVE